MPVCPRQSAPQPKVSRDSRFPRLAVLFFTCQPSVASNADIVCDFVPYASLSSKEDIAAQACNARWNNATDGEIRSSPIFSKLASPRLNAHASSSDREAEIGTLESAEMSVGDLEPSSLRSSTTPTVACQLVGGNASMLGEIVSNGERRYQANIVVMFFCRTVATTRNNSGGHPTLWT